MSRAFIEMIARAEYAAEMDGTMSKYGTLPEYDSDEDTVETVIQQTSWKSTGSSSSLMSPEASESQCRSSRSSWWNMEEAEAKSIAVSIQEKKRQEEQPDLPRGWRNPLDETSHCKSSKSSSKKKSEKHRTRFSWWNIEDEGPTKLSSKSSSKVDAKLAISNIEEKELAKKKKTKSDKRKKKSSKSDKMKRSKADNKKTKKSKKKLKEAEEELSTSSASSETEAKEDLSTSSASSETEPQPQPMPEPIQSIEEMEKESETLGFDAGLAFKVAVRKLQVLEALAKDFGDAQSIVTKSSCTGTCTGTINTGANKPDGEAWF